MIGIILLLAKQAVNGDKLSITEIVDGNINDQIREMISHIKLVEKSKVPKNLQNNKNSTTNVTKAIRNIILILLNENFDINNPNNFKGITDNDLNESIYSELTDNDKKNIKNKTIKKILTNSLNVINKEINNGAEEESIKDFKFSKFALQVIKLVINGSSDYSTLNNLHKELFEILQNSPKPPEIQFC